MSKPKSVEPRAVLAQALKEIPLENRESFVAFDIFTSKMKQFGTVICQFCWLSIPECICIKATRIKYFPHKLVVIVHPEEYARSSNTGSLVQVCMPPQDVAVLVKGVPEHDAEIAARCLEPNTFVLFPSQDAKTFSELEMSIKTQAQPVTYEISYNIIIVDGTWTQAKKIERSLPPHVPRVCLESLERLPEALKRPMRAHSDSSKVCTLAALIQLLADMRCTQSVMESLSELLALKTAVICQGKEQTIKKKRE
jgi:DTW domain-containing protein YfiP